MLDRLIVIAGPDSSGGDHTHPEAAEGRTVVLPGVPEDYEGGGTSLTPQCGLPLRTGRGGRSLN